jgi:hypothetical protein
MKNNKIDILFYWIFLNIFVLKYILISYIISHKVINITIKYIMLY